MNMSYTCISANLGWVEDVEQISDVDVVEEGRMGRGARDTTRGERGVETQCPLEHQGEDKHSWHVGVCGR
jgi:hypothetical protein